MGRERTCRALKAALIAGAVACAHPARPRARRRPCPGASASPASTSAHTIDTATLCLINRTRAAHHLPALRNNRVLGAVATAQVRTMVRMDYFSDVRPTGQTPMSLVRSSHYPGEVRRAVGRRDHRVGQRLLCHAGAHLRANGWPRPGIAP